MADFLLGIDYGTGGAKSIFCRRIITDTMEPDAKNHRLYMEYFQLYKNIYNHVKQDFRDLADLRTRARKLTKGIILWSL